MTPVLIPSDEMNALLTERIEALVHELLPNARRQGNELCVGSIHGEAGQSLRIHIGAGAKRGYIRDFSAGYGADPIKLIADVLFGGDAGKAFAWARSWLGIDGADPARIEQHRLEARAIAERRAAAAAEEIAAKRRQAMAIWQQARPLARGDVVDKYLLSRGIDLAELGHAPGVLRFAPSLAYWIFDKAINDWRVQAELPAMVAQVNALDGRFVAVHRTWLLPDGSGKAGADELGLDHRGRPRDAKKVLGAYEGGHVKLWLGRKADGSRVTGPLRTMPGERLHLSEGIEDGLTAVCADPSLAAAATVSGGNLAKIELPEQARIVVLLKQNDPPGSDAARAYGRGVAYLRAEGRRVLEVRVPGGVKDLNDLAQAG